MNFGKCPYCDGFLGFLITPNQTPAFAKIPCEECGETVWYRFSRVDPMAYTVEDFNRLYIVDDEARTIEERTPGVIQ